MVNSVSIIKIKHGCTEFYKSYPKFENINFDGEQEIKYNYDWLEKENSIDKLNPIRLKNDKKVWVKSIKGLNLSDILIIKNWIHYANLIGDNSYKIVCENNIKNSFLSKVLENQLSFRKEDLISIN